MSVRTHSARSRERGRVMLHKASKNMVLVSADSSASMRRLNNAAALVNFLSLRCRFQCGNGWEGRREYVLSCQRCVGIGHYHELD